MFVWTIIYVCGLYITSLYREVFLFSQQQQQQQQQQHDTGQTAERVFERSICLRRQRHRDRDRAERGKAFSHTETDSKIIHKKNKFYFLINCTTCVAEMSSRRSSSLLCIMSSIVLIFSLLPTALAFRSPSLRPTVRSSLTQATDDSDELLYKDVKSSGERGMKGFYRRPSKAIEQGGGFFVPGLEGERVRLLTAFALLVALLGAYTCSILL
jgi:hypothetical protein